jgi:hypothetical protein
MAQAGQFGSYYGQLVERFYAALEWRYNEVKDEPKLAREAEILSLVLDTLLADQVAHDVPLHALEGALKHFQKVRHDSFTPNKYKDILHHLNLDEKRTHGYHPQLVGNVTIERHKGA